VLEHDSETRKRIDAARKLEELGPLARNAVPNLIASLSDPRIVYSPRPLPESPQDSSTVRAAAADALGQIGMAANPAIPSLRKLMTSDHDDQVRVAAARAVYRIRTKDAEAFDVIVSVLSDRTGEEGPKSAAYALASIGREARAAVPGLMEAMKHRNYWVREAATQALAHVAGKDAIGHLLKSIKQKDDFMKRDAAAALGELGREAAPAIPALIDLLNYKDGRYAECARSGAAKALGHIGEPAKVALPALKAAMNDEDERVRNDAAIAFDKLSAAESP